MKKQQVLIIGAIVAFVVVGGLYFLAASDVLTGKGSITGAVVGPSGCNVPQSYLSACKEFKAGNWEFKPAEFDHMSAAVAKANCEKWLAGKC